MARKILLADDSVTAQNMGRKILADAGYDVIAVNNGSAALKKIAELKPDLAILDVYMPGYSGLEVCQRLKELPDSARIPVLLSVGKLEPFKPEEAQRVRAEGYIVKPFEASELLSALAKLEDKIVPRPETSKPGRLARVTASVEETGSGSRGESTNAGGWEKRISFPQQKNEPESTVADDASIYNPMNRDLRTTIETPAEKLAEKEQKQVEETKEQEASVDVAALASAGMPKDVTPEEIAAIASAAAQIQMAATLGDEKQESDGQASEAAAPAGEEVPLQKANSEENDRDPVTMAATAGSVAEVNSNASRWSAVAVALEDEEAKLVLEQEMQKAFRAFNAEELASAPCEPALAEVASDNSANEAEALPAVAVATEPEPALALPTEAAAGAEANCASPNSVESPDTIPEVSSTSVADVSAAQLASIPEPESTSNIQSAASTTESIATEFPPVPSAESSWQTIAGDRPATADETMSPVADLSQPGQPSPSEWHPVVKSEAVNEEADLPNSTFSPIARDEEPAPFDSEAVKSTAAAWASWRQIRDNGKEKADEASAAQPSQPAQIEALHDLSNNAALAAAAGAEQISPEPPPAPSNGHSVSVAADVASIVDSVLADLRPKLMEEISRKMAEKK